MQPILRVADESDAREIAALVNRAYRPSPHERGWTHEAELVSGDRTSVEQVSAIMSQRSRILLLCSGTTIVACVHVQVSESNAYIGMLATDPHYQVQGLGKQMLLNAEAYAVEHFSVRTFRMVVLSFRDELIAFYERRGYERTGQVEDYPLSAGVGEPKRPGLTVEVMEKKAAFIQADFSSPRAPN
jgi:ribosomal protein S18 acetylase RimI-like enzyme